MDGKAKRKKAAKHVQVHTYIHNNHVADILHPRLVPMINQPRLREVLNPWPACHWNHMTENLMSARSPGVCVNAVSQP